MTQLQQNRYDQLLRRVADLKGPGSKVNDVLTELFPMIDVENPPAELLVLMGSRIAIGSINQPAPGALLFEQHMLSNPVGSGAIITLLECVTSCSNTNQRIGYGLTQNTLAGTALEAFTDGRAFPDGTIGKVLHAGELVTGVTFGQMRCIAAVNLFISPPLPQS